MKLKRLDKIVGASSIYDIPLVALEEYAKWLGEKLSRPGCVPTRVGISWYHHVLWTLEGRKIAEAARKELAQ